MTTATFERSSGRRICSLISKESGKIIVCDPERSCLGGDERNIMTGVEITESDHHKWGAANNAGRQVDPPEEKVLVPEPPATTEIKDDALGDEKKVDDAPESTMNEEREDALTTAVSDTELISPKKQPFERDYDQEPTELYLMIQKKAWRKTIERARGNPEEARVWVYRKEGDGTMRWRLLPIHAAIVFKAPEDVVEALLAAYPKGAQSKDDQGMLPLHLAFRNGSTEGVVNLLLVAYPQSIDVEDRKGRIPLVLAQASTSPNRDAFMRALERGPTYYAVAAAATERAAVTAEQRAIFDAKLMQLRQSHQHEMTQLKIEHETKEQTLQLQLDSMEKELVKTQETSQVLVDHVNSLEAQLTSRSDTERFLATKIATLDSSLKDTYRTREEIESALKSENIQVVLERDNLLTKLKDSEQKYTATQEKLDLALEMRDKMEKEFEQRELKLREQMKGFELDWASSHANCAILDAQLKKKVETEHALATQVSALASKLAEAAAEARDSSTLFSKRIRDLEEERQMLRGSVQDLTKRLYLVAQLLEEMTKQQKAIVSEAQVQEEVMTSTLDAHAKIVEDARRQQEAFDEANEEREKMVKALEEQKARSQEVQQERVGILNAIEMQGQHMAETKKGRDELLTSVECMGAEIQGVLDNVLNIIPNEVEDEKEMVDAVCDALSGKAVPKEKSPEKGKVPCVTPRTMQAQNDVFFNSEGDPSIVGRAKDVATETPTEPEGEAQEHAVPEKEEDTTEAQAKDVSMDTSTEPEAHEQTIPQKEEAIESKKEDPPQDPPQQVSEEEADNVDDTEKHEDDTEKHEDDAEKHEDDAEKHEDDAEKHEDEKKTNEGGPKTSYEETMAAVEAATDLVKQVNSMNSLNSYPLPSDEQNVTDSKEVTTASSSEPTDIIPEINTSNSRDPDGTKQEDSDLYSNASTEGSSAEVASDEIAPPSDRIASDRIEEARSHM